jgi:amidase
MKRLSRENTVPLHSRYRVFDPVLTIDPGETILVETINHMTPVVRSVADLHPHGSPEYREREETGPIYVRGAQPGDMLAIHIEHIDIIGLPHAHGWGPLADVYPQEPIGFPVRNGRCELPGGISVPLHPMIGDIYTTPTSSQYFDHGGNMDFTEVRPGNTLYLPVFHEGGLLVMGDVHAAQGDGEVLGEGAESTADVTVSISIDREYRNPRPVVETPDALICLACRDTLFRSIRLATEDMTELLSNIHGISKADAYILCTLTGSIRMGGSLSAQRFTEGGCLVCLSAEKDISRL